MMLTIVKMMLVMMMMIHFRGTSANISIAEIGNVARNAFRVPRRFREPWFSDPFRESLRGASALQVFTSARSSYFKPKIKRIHGGFGRCSVEIEGTSYGISMKMPTAKIK
jgi:hypothetical protein